MTTAQFFTALATQAPFVIAAVMGLGTVYGEYLHLKGLAQLGACFATGLVLGAVGMLALGGIPTDLAGWYWVAISGILMGLMPSGIYKMGVAVVTKSTHNTDVEKSVYNPEDPQ